MPESTRPEASHDPAIELMEEPSDVGAFVVLAPATQDGIDLLYQFRCRYRRAATCQSSNLVLEVTDRFLAWIGIQSLRVLTFPPLSDMTLLIRASEGLQPS